MVSGIRFDGSRIELDGYPEGSSVRGIAGPDAQELCRLLIFRANLQDVVDWLAAAKEAEGSAPKICEALCDAALVKFCSCFEGTSGLRAKPLRRKEIFSGDDRKTAERLRLIRNKMVAHDEHLYPGEYPLVVLNRDIIAIEAVVLRLNAPFSCLTDVDDLRRLAAIAFEWIKGEFETVASKIVSDTNSLPDTVRRVMHDTTPEFQLTITEPMDKF